MKTPKLETVKNSHHIMFVEYAPLKFALDQIATSFRELPFVVQVSYEPDTLLLKDISLRNLLKDLSVDCGSPEEVCRLTIYYIRKVLGLVAVSVTVTTFNTPIPATFQIALAKGDLVGDEDVFNKLMQT